MRRPGSAESARELPQKAVAEKLAPTLTFADWRVFDVENPAKGVSRSGGRRRVKFPRR
jgi:hypothetical protein